VRTLSGVRRGYMASFSCSGSRSPKPRYRVTCPHQADGQHSRGGPFFAIKPVRSVSIPRSGQGGYARLPVPSHWAKLKRSTAAQIATVCIGFWRGLRRPQPALNAGRISLVSAQRDRGVTYGARRVASVPGGSGRALDNRSGTAVAIRSPPHQAWALPCLRPWATQDAALAQSRARFHHAGR
jgi:hypothetical protein